MPTNMPAKPVMPSKPAPPARPAPMAASKGRKGIALGLVGLLVGLVAGYGAGRVSTGTPVNPLSGSGTGGTYQDGYNAAKKKIDDAHVFPPLSATSLNGTVKSVGTDSLVVDVSIVSPNPLETISAPSARTVSVTADTKIDRQVQKTPEQQQKDLAQFQADLAAGKAGILPPSPVTTETVKLSDLQAGDQVVVAADHDILNAASFTATEITLVQSPATNAPTPPPPPPAAPAP